jgi:hypothetical protein
MLSLEMITDFQSPFKLLSLISSVYGQDAVTPLLQTLQHLLDVSPKIIGFESVTVRSGDKNAAAGNEYKSLVQRLFEINRVPNEILDLNWQPSDVIPGEMIVHRLDPLRNKIE